MKGCAVRLLNETFLQVLTICIPQAEQIARDNVQRSCFSCKRL